MGYGLRILKNEDTKGWGYKELRTQKGRGHKVLRILRVEDTKGCGY